MFLGGLICENGAKLIKDLRSVLGKNYPLIAPDGFSDFTAERRRRADGHVRQRRRHPAGEAERPGKTFVDDFGAQIGTQVNPYPPTRRRLPWSCWTRSPSPTEVAEP